MADCAAVFHRAITATTNPNDPRPGLDYANFIRGSLVFLDTHPTPLGYELEARVVAAALKKSGAVRGLADEDPIVYLRQAKLAQPSIHQIPTVGAGLAFSGVGRTDERFTILVGHPGSCVWRNLALPIDLEGILGSNTDGFVASPTVTGRVLAEIPAGVCASWTPRSKPLPWWSGARRVGSRPR